MQDTTGNCDFMDSEAFSCRIVFGPQLWENSLLQHIKILYTCVLSRLIGISNSYNCQVSAYFFPFRLNANIFSMA